MLSRRGAAMRFIIFSLLFVLICTSQVFAIGVSPPVYRIDYEEGATHTFDFLILNKDGRSSDVRMYADGAFGEYVTFSEDTFDFEGAQTYPITATLTLPNYSDVPGFGKQRLNLHAEEFSTAGGAFSAVTAVGFAVFIQVPQPGRFGEPTTFTIPHTVEGFDTSYTLEITNRGTDDLTNTNAQVSIVSATGEQQEQFTITNINLLAGASQTFNDEVITSTYTPGKYIATASYIYDQAKAPTTEEVTFFVGSTDIELVDYTTTLVKGKINKINITLQSLWGSPLDSIRGMLVLGANQQALPAMDFLPFESKVVQAFIDVPLTNQTSTEALLHLQLPFNDGVIEKDIELNFVLVDEFIEEESQSNTLLIIALIVLIIFATVLLVSLGKQTKTSKKKKK